MANKSLVELNLDQDFIKNIVVGEIKQGIASKFNMNKSEIIGEIVYKFLSQQVDENGKIPKYNSDKRMTRLEHMAHVGITEILKEIMKEWLAENRDEVKKELSKHLKSQRKSIIKSMFGTMESSFENTYRMKVEISE